MQNAVERKLEIARHIISEYFMALQGNNMIADEGVSHLIKGNWKKLHYLSLSKSLIIKATTN